MASVSINLRDEVEATEFYDRRFQRGYMTGWSSDKCDRVAELIGQLGLPRTGRALDFGCGAGVFTKVLRRALPDWTIEGTDLSTVAVETAARRLPDCRFFPFRECSTRTGQFDLVFTHHVLEHVSDIHETARLLADISKPSASMFHILPCGNAGSFEEGICLIRTDGIRSDPERVFFFEEEGHLRRLDTEAIAALWRPSGYTLSHEWYGEHRIGALGSRTSFGMEDVLSYADPAKAIDKAARKRLRTLRIGMLALWAARKPIAVVRTKLRLGCHNSRDYALLAAGLVAYPIAAGVEGTLKYLEAREWSSHCHERAGSEMFIHLVRP